MTEQERHIKSKCATNEQRADIYCKILLVQVSHCGLHIMSETPSENMYRIMHIISVCVVQCLFAEDM